MTTSFAATGYTLRPAATDQTAITLDAIASGEAEALGEAFAAIQPWVSYPYPAAGLAKYFADVEPGAPRFALRSDGALCGAVGLRLNWLRGPYLQFLGILPVCEGKGLGHLVLEWLEAEARTANERNLWVAASDFNADAIRFYNRYGFAVVASLPDLVRDGRSELLMRRKLA